MHSAVGILRLQAGEDVKMFVIVGSGSVYPAPEYPYDILPYIFFAYLIVGAAWFARLKAKSPETLASIQHDMEG